MLATEKLSIRPFHKGDDDFIAALAFDAFDEFTPDAVPHTISLVRRCTTLIALRDLGPVHEVGPVGEVRYVERTPGRAGEPLEIEKRPRRRRVGFAAISEEGNGLIQLNAIAVVRGERGRGIGHYLMLACEQLGRGRGGRRLELCTADCNLAALDLFIRHGFRISRRRERFYDRGQDACILVKDLR